MRRNRRSDAAGIVAVLRREGGMEGVGKLIEWVHC
jgi:hypothetical protein